MRSRAQIKNLGTAFLFQGTALTSASSVEPDPAPSGATCAVVRTLGGFEHEIQ
jgi:hypothetical protein